MFGMGGGGDAVVLGAASSIRHPKILRFRASLLCCAVRCRLAGDQRVDLLSFVGAFPSLSHSERKMALLDFILERGGLHLDALGLDLLAR